MLWLDASSCWRQVRSWGSIGRRGKRGEGREARGGRQAVIRDVMRGCRWNCKRQEDKGWEVRSALLVRKWGRGDVWWRWWQVRDWRRKARGKRREFKAERWVGREKRRGEVSWGAEGERQEEVRAKSGTDGETASYWLTQEGKKIPDTEPNVFLRSCCCHACLPGGSDGFLPLLLLDSGKADAVPCCLLRRVNNGPEYFENSYIE